MTASSISSVPESRRRVVLVDFDWEDADLIPELLQQRGISVRLVAGSRPEDAGIRLAELCGLPRTVDLADLTREIFDLALVSERSPRRTQIEGLLLALGTPSLTPQTFVTDDGHPGETMPAVEAPLELHAAALETALGGEDFDELVDQALPDLSDRAPTTPQPIMPPGAPRFTIPSLEDFPSHEDRRGLEAALRSLMMDTGAERAELHVEGPEDVELVVEVGAEDLLLSGLVELAQMHGRPQVVASVSGTPSGTAWGAWPFRTTQHRGVVAAAGIQPDRWSAWERMVEDLRSTWERRDREQVGAAAPMLPAIPGVWLEPAAFVARLDRVVERHRRDGLRVALHRLEFPISRAAVDRLAERLPLHLRGTDAICRPAPNRVLLLTATPGERSPHVRGRIAALWQEAWLETGNERPIPGIVHERCELTRPDGTESFMARARRWMESDPR